MSRGEKKTNYEQDRIWKSAQQIRRNTWKYSATQIVGYAADETKRIGSKTTKGKILPLVDHGITEADAFEICRKAELLSPVYDEDRTRLGCWFCHNQRLGELRRLRQEYPELWARLLALDKDSERNFKPDMTVRCLERRFEFEDAHLMLSTLTFSMLLKLELILMLKNWIYPAPDESVIEALRLETGLPRFICILLANRGYASAESVSALGVGTAPRLQDPMTLTVCGNSQTPPTSSESAQSFAVSDGNSQLSEVSSEAVQTTDFPKSTITIICPWAVGGGGDVVCRIMAELLGKELGTNVKNWLKEQSEAQ